MLIKCNECGINVSDLACICPHCGFPISQYKHIPSSASGYTKYCINSIYKCIKSNTKEYQYNKFPSLEELTSGKDGSVRIVQNEESCIYLEFRYTCDTECERYNSNPKVIFKLKIFKGYDEVDSFNIKEIFISFNDRFRSEIKDEIKAIKFLIKSCTQLSDTMMDPINWTGS